MKVVEILTDVEQQVPWGLGVGLRPLLDHVCGKEPLESCNHSPKDIYDIG